MNGFGVSPLELMAADAMLNGLVYLDEFIYSALWLTGTATALGANATVDVQVQINGDSDFIVQEQNLVAFDNSHAIVASPNLRLTLVRAGSGREIMSQPQHVLNICGGYQATRFPGRKPMAGLINANNLITCKLQNLSSVVFDSVDLSFIGFKVFYTTSMVSGEQGSRQKVFHAL